MTFQEYVATRFGVLTAGQHPANGEACVLESWNAYQGRAWSDDPDIARCWDLRALNDIDVAPAIRTTIMVQLMDAFAGSADWPAARQQRVAELIALGTVQRLIAELPGLSESVRAQCRRAGTLMAAQIAAEAARAAPAAGVAGVDARAAAGAAAEAARAARAAEAAWAASAAARAAADAADAAGAAAEAVFSGACALWLDAATTTA